MRLKPLYLTTRACLQTDRGKDGQQGDSSISPFVVGGIIILFAIDTSPLVYNMKALSPIFQILLQYLKLDNTQPEAKCNMGLNIYK